MATRIVSCAAAARRSSTASMAAWNGAWKSAMRRARSLPPRSRLPGISVVSLTSGMRSGASCARLQSMTSRDTVECTRGASSISTSASDTASAPGSQAMCRSRSIADRPRSPRSSGMRLEAWSQTSTKGDVPPALMVNAGGMRLAPTRCADVRSLIASLHDRPSFVGLSGGRQTRRWRPSPGDVFLEELPCGEHDLRIDLADLVLVVGPERGPGGEIRIGLFEHGVAGERIGVPAGQCLHVDGGEFPHLQRVVVTVVEPLELHLAADRQP